MEKKDGRRGGARVGAGRKRMRKEDRRRVTHVGLSPDVAEWLGRTCGRGKGVFVEMLIREYWKRERV